MNAWFRIAAAVVFLAVAGFCLFGFIATFEPMPAGTRWIWRTVHLLAGTASLMGALRPIRCQWRRMIR
jgi:hypothetical protein